MTRGRLAIASLVLLLLGLFWYLRRDPQAPAGSDVPAPVAKRIEPGPLAPELAPPEHPVGPLAIEATTASQRPMDEAPYPPGSAPLTEGSDPATSVPEDDPVDPDSGLHVVFGPRWDVVHPPDPIVIDLEVLDAKGKRVAVGNPRAYFRGERDTEAVGTGAEAKFVEDKRHGYTATFAPTRTQEHELAHFRVFVEVAFDAPHGLGERRYSTWVQYSPKAGAELSGDFTDAIVGGSLVITAGVDVHQAGRYKLIGSLYAGDTAIAFMQNAESLATGHQRLALTAFGKILHDKALAGPYELRFTMLFQELPEQGIYWPGTTVDHAYKTAAYRATDFSPDPYVRPEPEGPQVTAESPSQQGKPGPVFTR